MRVYTYQTENTCDYPVGRNMEYNKAAIIDLVNAFKANVELRSDTMLNIICRGSSGAIIASAFSFLLDQPTTIVYVRKPAEINDCHSHHDMDLAPLNNVGSHNIIVDDFISSGDTIDKIYRDIINYNPSVKIDGVCVTRCTSAYQQSFKPTYFITSAYGYYKNR